MAFNDSAHPLRKDLQRFLDETIWRGLSSRDNDEEEEWIDSSKVSEAILSNWFWSYMVMISALATGIHKIRRFSKSCPCHIENIDENGHLMSFKRRVLGFRKLSGSRNRCPANGLLAPWMALGKGREIVQEYLSKCQRLVLMSFDPLTRREIGSIQGEFDGAAAGPLWTIRFLNWRTGVVCL